MSLKHKADDADAVVNSTQPTQPTKAATVPESTTSQPPATTTIAQADLDALVATTQELQQQLLASQERERRALADYQNVVRRSQEDRLRAVKLAGAEFASVLLQPLDHLSRAAAQLQDKGLDMVVLQFQQALRQAGLEEIEVMGKPFDVHCMEAVETKEDGQTVIAVVTKGYTLNGEVIQHAKVVLG